MIGRRAAVVAVTAVLLVACSADEGAVGDRSAMTEAAVPPRVRASEAALARIDPAGPGCSAAVRVGDDLGWTGGRGRADLGAGTAMGDETVFDVGSTSKIFAATLVLALADQGRLATDDLLADHVAGLPAWVGEVTLDQLLHHTAGIPDYLDLLYDAGHTDADRRASADSGTGPR